MSDRPDLRALIQRKKEDGVLTPSELSWLCREYVAGAVPDYQVAAWLMAVCWRGMTEAETLALTQALVATGRTMEWSRDRPVVDKHSTGGVGDKTSIALVPLLAAAGLVFVKMSGRGLGHTGGTLDKLESIPGMRVDFTVDEVKRQVDRIGCALVGQSPELVPGDGALYALRDATATIDSVPLIASSIMSKKLAAGAPSIVLDVKYGAGAFMPTLDAARELAQSMVRIGIGAGRRVRALLTPMEEPLGAAVGNALEVAEAIDVLHGRGPADLRALVLELGAHLMVLSACTSSLDDARRGLGRLLDSGVGADHLERLIQAQGGDPRVVRDPGRLPRAPRIVSVDSPTGGWVLRVDAMKVADTALMLGAGRQRKGDRVDPRTGVRLLARAGSRVDPGQPIAEVHAGGDEQAANAANYLLGAFTFAGAEPELPASTPIVVGA